MNGPLLDFETPGMMGTNGTLLWWFLVFGAFGLLIARLVSGARRAARVGAKAAKEAESAILSDHPLTAGERVIEGHVELADGESTAARVEIDQEGREAESSGSWSFTWTEVQRRVTMRPFYLRLANGERVRVEPDDRAFLVDALDGMTVVDEIHRTRHAELSPGEHVYAAGFLDRGTDPEIRPETYRGGKGKGWVLSPPSSGELLLSAEPLGARYQRAARARRTAAWMAIGMTCVPLVLNAPGLYRLLGGEAIVANVVDRRTVENDDSTTYEVQIRVGDNLLWKETTSAFYGRATEGVRSWVTYVKANPDFSALGQDARGNAYVLLPSIVVLVLTLVWTGLTVRKSKRWYDDKVTDSGSGRLAENASAVKRS